MPHPKNHMKLTGDTHPPEVEYDLDEDDGTDTRFDDVELRMNRAEPQPEPFWTGEVREVSAARDFARTQPLAALGIALVVGYALLKLLRR